MSSRQYYHEGRLRDFFFAFLHILATAFFIYLAVIYFPASAFSSEISAAAPRCSCIWSQLESKPEIVGWTVLLASGAAVLLGWIWIGLVAVLPLFTWHITFIGSALFFAALALWCFIGEVALGFWFALGLCLLAIAIYIWSYRRVNFTALVAQNSLSLLFRYPGLFIVAFGALIWGFVFSAIALCTATGIIRCLRSGAEGGGGGICLPWNLIFLILYFLWSLVILRNIVICTIAAVTGAYHFFGDEEAQNRGCVSLRALFRTVFLSYGSCCFGALFIPLTDALTSLSKVKRGDGLEGSFNTMALVCCGCFSRTVETFNSHALVQVGICGKSFYESAIDTGYLMRERGFYVVVADLVVEEMIFVARCLIATLSVLGVWFWIVGPVEGSGVAIRASLIFGWIFAWCIFYILGSVVEGSVLATSVCFAMDPGLFSRRSAELYYRFKDRYAGFLNV